MVRPKRSSSTLKNAEQREAGLRTIEEKLDLGNGRTLKQYSQDIQSLRDAIATYNSTLSTLDNLSRDIKTAEAKLRHSSEHMLLGVAAKYGKDSREYGQAGGILKSERKRPSTLKTSRKSIKSVDSAIEQPIETLPIITVTSPNQVTSNGNGNGKTLVN
jgi:DNA repair ATPase RecN